MIKRILQWGSGIKENSVQVGCVEFKNCWNLQKLSAKKLSLGWTNKKIIFKYNTPLSDRIFATYVNVCDLEGFQVLRAEEIKNIVNDLCENPYDKKTQELLIKCVNKDNCKETRSEEEILKSIFAAVTNSQNTSDNKTPTKQYVSEKEIVEAELETIEKSEWLKHQMEV